MGHRYVLIIALLLLSSCATPRMDFDWEQYRNAHVEDTVTVSGPFDQTWSVLKNAGKELALTPIAEDRSSGILTFTKPDKRWRNTAYELTVMAFPRTADETAVTVRGFVFTTGGIVAVFPSDGELEENFLNAVRRRTSK